jgi:hypothetical protein
VCVACRTCLASPTFLTHCDELARIDEKLKLASARYEEIMALSTKTSIANSVAESCQAVVRRECKQCGVDIHEAKSSMAGVMSTATSFARDQYTSLVNAASACAAAVRVFLPEAEEMGALLDVDPAQLMLGAGASVIAPVCQPYALPADDAQKLKNSLANLEYHIYSEMMETDAFRQTGVASQVTPIHFQDEGRWMGGTCFFAVSISSGSMCHVTNAPLIRVHADLVITVKLERVKFKEVGASGSAVPNAANTKTHKSGEL